jgi:MFS family permease
MASSYTNPDWTADERPTMPGSAATLQHSMPKRIAYILVGILLGLTGGLGNALVSANLPTIQGELGLTTVEATWLTAAYLMVNISSNLVLFKFRQQFGLRRFAEIGLPLYAAVSILHLFVHSYPSALFVRAISGFAAGPISALCTMYIMQAVPKSKIGPTIVIALGLSQLTTPLAWMLSPTLIDLGEWRSLYLFEAGLSLCCLAAVVVLKLPHGIRAKVFEGADFVTFALLAPAMALMVAVLAQGRLQWWNTQTWIAWALMAALVLASLAILIEWHRKNPLLQVRWMGRLATIRFVIGAMGMRFLLSEQTYGATGFLRTLGMGVDQLQPLYAVILAGLVFGIAASALTFNQKTLIPQILVSVVLIGIASLLDADASNLTRPHDMYVSQFMISMASTMFMGPLMLTGITSALKNGPNYMISFVVLFSVSQSVGGLAGPAILGTIQQMREHTYSSTINAGVDPTQGVVAQRLQAQGQVYSRVLTDPVLRQAQGTAQLAQLATREANVRAYNDIFLLNAFLALAFLGWSLFHALRIALAARQAPANPAPPSGATLRPDAP